MAVKTLHGSYPAGYSLNPAYQTLNLTASAYVGGTGIECATLARVDNLGAVVSANGHIGIMLDNGGTIVNGSLSNTGAYIKGGAGAFGIGVLAVGATVRLVNFGTITTAPTLGPPFSPASGGSVSEDAVFLPWGGTIVNEASGLIRDGAVVRGGGSILNEGLIVGRVFEATYASSPELFQSDYAIRLSGGQLTNGSPDNTTAKITDGVWGYSADCKVVNFATIEAGYALGGESGATSTRTVSVNLTGGGLVTNGGNADHSALFTGSVVIQGGTGTVINGGTIRYGLDQGSGWASVYVISGGEVINGSRLNTAALIENGVLTGRGSIPAVGYCEITNYGTIETSDGPRLGVDFISGGRLTNGSIDDRSATISGSTGVMLAKAGTIVNFGTIASSARAAGVAVSLHGVGDTLVEEGGAVLIGRLLGAGNSLELGGDAGTGTISGLGTNITGFKLVEVDAGAGWHFTGTNSIAVFETVTNAAAIIDEGAMINNGTVDLGALLQLSSNASVTNTAGGQITILGNVGIAAASGATGMRIVNAGTIVKSGGTGVSNLTANIANTGAIIAGVGTLNVGGAVTGAGTWTVDGSATLEFRFAVASSVTVALAGSGADLELTDTLGFTGRVSGFGAGETIDLRQIGLGPHTALSYSGTATSGVLTVSNGAHVANVALLGQYMAANFHLSSDAQGGTDVTFVATPSAAALAIPVGR